MKTLLRLGVGHGVAALLLLGCGRSETDSTVSRASPSGASPSPAAPSPASSSMVPPLAAEPKQGAPTPSTGQPAALPTCPEGLVPILGGTFAVGSASVTYEGEENPRFWTKVASFCADRTEVTALTYRNCLAAGRCSEPEHTSKRCTVHAPGKEDHPVNCITYAQAEAVCSFRGLRLPTEVEWEYLARGGEEMRKYPWGDREPDGRTCWKHPETCAVGSFGAGAFGLADVTGNVWEWTSSWFAPYPWPSEKGRHRVYRGGSFSRRFEKWLKPTLRNRSNPTDSGSHLGVRCVSDAADAVCPYGRERATLGAQGAEKTSCLFGVERVECPQGSDWNGVRCAKAGEPRCAAGTQEVEGRGCVGPEGAARPSGSKAEHGAGELDTSLVSRTRSPQFDADCVVNQPTRPIAYRYSGGEHLARNRVMAEAGCKNRDVGVGWNSGCCPR